MENSFFNSVEIVKVLNHWKKHLLIVGLISFALSAFISSPLVIKPKFKSSAIIYPSNLIAFSNESTTEQMLQITQSTDIRDWIIKNFHLYKHYGIDTLKNKHHESEIFRMYDDNVSIRQTEYESMEITVFDTDPVIASQMVDSIIHYFDVKSRQLQASKSKEVMIIAKNQLDQKQAEMDSIERRMENLRKEYGLLDYKEQSKEATKAYLRAMGTNGSAERASKQILDALKEKGGEFNAMNEHLWRIRGSYNDLKGVYENAKRDVYKQLTYANVVTRPEVADQKSYPIRWLIVAISVGSSLFLAFLIILIFQSKKHLSR